MSDLKIRLIANPRAIALAVASVAFLSAADLAHAANASWLAAPTNSNWGYTSGTATNWTPINTIPGTTDLNPALLDTATFGASSQLTVLPDLNRTIGSINFGTGAGSYTIGASAGNTLYLAGNGSGGITAGATGTNIVETFAGPLSLLQSYQFLSSSTVTNDTMVVTGSITNNVTTSAIGSPQLQLKGTNTGANTVSGVISDGGTYATKVSKLNTGTWIISGANTYTGATAIGQGILTASTLNHIAAGTLGGLATPAASSNLGAPTTVTNGTIAFGATTTTGQLTYTGTGETTDRVINLFGTTGGGIIDQSGTGLLKFTANSTASGVGAKTLTLQGSTAGTGEIAGIIRDNAAANPTSVAKGGSGTWTLSAVNIYTGSTTVSAGTLSLANASAIATSGSTGVSGGTLSSSVASTTLGGNLTLSSGGLTANGSSVGTFALAAGKTFTMSGGTLAESITSTSAFDKITASGGGTFSLTGGALDLTGSTIDYTATYAVLSGFTSGTVGGTFGITGYDTADYTASLSNAGVLSFAAIPEPAALGMLAISVMGFARRRRAI